jgi:hypothetical protein
VVYNPVSKVSTPTALKQDYHSIVPLNSSLVLARGNALYDTTAKIQTVIQGPAGAQSLVVYGVNDLSEIVGAWYSSTPGSNNVFLASPQ